jgi:cytochrome c peroxidase
VAARFAILWAIVLALAAIFASQGQATTVKEAPWQPDAAAYRATLFLGNLTPIPWETLEQSWTAPYPGASSDIAAMRLLSQTVPRDAALIARALNSRKRQKLFAASTQALANALNAHLTEAGAQLGSGDPRTAISRAQAIYRAFEDGIKAADPLSHRNIGLAWLKLTNSIGSRGMLGAGHQAADRASFDHSAGYIREYISTNFAPSEFTPRETFAALPESVVATGTNVIVPPSLPPSSVIAEQSPLPRLVLNFEEQGIKEADLPLVAYGDMLFDSPTIFSGPANTLGIACSTCHNRSDLNRDFFIPGISFHAGSVDVDSAFFNPPFNDRRHDPVDIPSLRGIRFTGPYGRDGREASLRGFTRNVIVTEFAGAEPTPFMLDALVAYMLEFDFLPNSKVTPQGQLTASVSAAAKRGEAIFKRPFATMDGDSCASCHTPSSNFLDRKAHDIGSKTPGYEGARASTFDTPTLLGANFTAPYFHDGSLPTLASVTAWFDRRFKLDLSAEEQADLTAYVEAVGDADQPYETFDAKHTPFRLAFEELTTFASTLDLLIPKQDVKHALILVDTVATDLAKDASIMRNLAAKQDVYHLSTTLAAVGTAIRVGDWAEAQLHWNTFKTAQAAVAERMF